MKKILAFFILILVVVTTHTSCQTKEDSCNYDRCDPRRKTIKTANNVKGVISVLDSRHMSVWVIVSEQGIIGSTQPTFDGPDIVIPCNLPDSLKVTDLKVIFSGDLKESCGEYKSPLSILAQVRYDDFPKTIPSNAGV